MSSFFIVLSGGGDFLFEKREVLALLPCFSFFKKCVYVEDYFMEIANIARHSHLKEREYTDVNASSKVVVQNIENMAGENEPAISARSFDPTLLRRVVDQIRNTFNMFDKRLHFRVNTEANTVVVEVVDSKTNTVIREIPSEEMQEVKRKIEAATGTFIDVNA